MLLIYSIISFKCMQLFIFVLSVCVTVVVRSQVVDLVSRGSAAGETRCPCREAG